MWRVICKPVEDNPQSGLAVILTDGEEERETTRVGFLRDKSKHAKVGFAKQLQAELDKAEEAATTINELYEEAQRAEAEARERAMEKLREILGDPTGELE
jgi:hypothetical protein